MKQQVYPFLGGPLAGQQIAVPADRSIWQCWMTDPSDPLIPVSTRPVDSEDFQLRAVQWIYWKRTVRRTLAVDRLSRKVTHWVEWVLWQCESLDDDEFMALVDADFARGVQLGQFKSLALFSQVPAVMYFGWVARISGGLHG